MYLNNKFPMPNYNFNNRFAQFLHHNVNKSLKHIFLHITYILLHIRYISHLYLFTISFFNRDTFLNSSYMGFSTVILITSLIAQRNLLCADRCFFLLGNYNTKSYVTLGSIT